MALKTSFKGAVTEIITPFQENGELDGQLLENEVEFQVKSGIAGLFTNGLASECLSLTLEEKVNATEIICRQADGRIPVMGNVTGNNYDECLRLLKEYEKAGVDAVSFTQPMTYGFTQEGMYRYLTDLIHEAGVPVCIYNAPQTGNVLSPSTVARLLNENELVYYYKESTIDLVHIQNTMRLIDSGKEYEFLAGSDASTLPIAMLGGKGVISLISAVFPKIIIRLCNEIEGMQMDAARKTQEEILQIRDALKIGPFMAGYKYAAELVGVPMGVVRKPLVGLTEAEKSKIQDNLKKLDLIS